MEVAEVNETTRLLKELLEVQGVEDVVCVGRDGFVIASESRGRGDAEAIGAMISTGLGSAESIGRELNVGGLIVGTMEYGKGIVLFASLGADVLLSIVATKDANLGNIRLQAKRRMPDLEKSLK